VRSFDPLTRREFVRGATVLLGAAALPLPLAFAAETHGLPGITSEALDQSPLVYVSPLKSDGAESKCHGEVWFFHDGGDVVLATGKDAWKSRAVDQGLARARIWVGDFGPVGKAGDKYRAAPTFEAKARFDTDPAVFERLMTSFSTKYADGWEKWGPRFRKGYADGSRRLIRYTPVGA
jgi:hypothetical protein